jgi:hypothetical protein
MIITQPQSELDSTDDIRVVPLTEDDEDLVLELLIQVQNLMDP